MKEDKGILFEKHGHSNLLVTFGGINQNMGMPVFEFYKSLNKIKCDKCFIRDFNQAWYHLGVSHDHKSIEALKKHLKKIISEGNYKSVSFVGNSMGGYAAILFGVLLNVDNILVFSPQTFIGKWKRMLNRDKRWTKQINRIHKSKIGNREYFDLKTILNSSNTFKGAISIFFSKNDKLDSVHSKRLKHFNFVKLNEMDLGGHNLVKELKMNGKLDTILAELFI